MSRWPTLVGKLLTIHSLLRDIEVPWDHSDSNVLVVDWHAAPVVREDAQKVIMKHHIIPACEIQSLGQSHPCWDLGILEYRSFLHGQNARAIQMHNRGLLCKL